MGKACYLILFFITLHNLPEANGQQLDTLTTNTERTYFLENNNGYAFSWGAEEGYFLSSPNQPQVTVKWERPGGPFLLWVRVLNEAGCLDSTAIWVWVIEPNQVFFPSAFSPNGDGVNDLLTLNFPYAQFTRFDFRIYNRWGKIVFQSLGPNFSWDGSYLGQPLPADTYIWQFEVQLPNNPFLAQKGTLTLFR